MTEWRSRGYLPHFDKPQLVQSITFRLFDAVPEQLVEQWKTELGWTQHLPSTDRRKIQLQKRIDRYEDAGFGACWLRDDRLAEVVENALLFFDPERYRLISWCIMPNHVHTIIQTEELWPLGGVVHSWKSYTSHKANRLLHQSGEFWFREYHDRYIRDGEHLNKAIDYVESNPVKAGFARFKEEWRWSSARIRQ
jgi:REP element-mobilizing transposase RayT